MAAIEQGRALYNFRCYFCHGYSGDAKTVAADQLSPRPRDFTSSPDLSRQRILAALKDGRPGTAMKSFATLFKPAEMESLSAFILSEFVAKGARNTAYHTPENGWFDHQTRYGLAYPFVLGEIGLSRPLDSLNAKQQSGRALYLDACITCHEAKSADPIWESHPHSYQGTVARTLDAVSAASHYALHDRPPRIEGLSALEAKGKALYEENCAFCHAADGTGKNWIGAFLEPHPRNFTDLGESGHIDDARLDEAILDGIPGSSMPAWRNVLSEEQRLAIAAYVKRAFLAPARNAPSAKK